MRTLTPPSDGAATGIAADFIRFAPERREMEPFTVRGADRAETRPLSAWCIAARARARSGRWHRRDGIPRTTRPHHETGKVRSENLSGRTMSRRPPDRTCSPGGARQIRGVAPRRPSPATTLGHRPTPFLTLRSAGAEGRRDTASRATHRRSRVVAGRASPSPTLGGRDRTRAAPFPLRAREPGTAS